MREVLNAIFYLNRSGCQWDMLPHDLPAKSTVYDHFAQWKADGTWQRILDALRQQVRVAGGHDPNPSAGEHRQPDGQGDRDRRQPGVRRGQEDHRAEAAYPRGQAGVAAGRRGDGRLGRRRHDRPRGAGPTDGRAPDPAEERSGPTGSTATITSNGWLVKTEAGYVIEVVGRPAGSVGFVKLPQAVGGGADVRLAGPVPAAQPGLRAVHRVERGDDQGQFDSSHAQALETRSVEEADAVQIPEITGKNYRIAS